MLAVEFLSQFTLRFVLLGLATGSLVALVALGIVLVYRASGVLNFAAGAQGAIGAFVCYSLRDGHGQPAWLAVTAGLLTGAVMGAGMCGVMAWIRHASLLSKLIASLALFSASYGFVVVVWGNDVVQPRPFLPSDNVTLVGELRIGEDRLILIALALVLAGALRVVYTTTRFGLATSAVAENRRVAASAGWSVALIELINYTVAGVLSALAAILLAPIVTLNAALLSLTVLGALAAALVGRFSSFGITVAAALVVGVISTEVALFQNDIAEAVGVSAQSLTGLAEVAPLVIILSFAILSGRGRLGRGETLVRMPLPGSGRVSVIPLALGGLGSVSLLLGVEAWASTLTITFGLAILVLSVVVVSGFAGQLSLCQFALAGFGAWVAAKLVSTDGLPLELAFVIAVASTVFAGVVVALPAIRTRGVNLAVATLALALLFKALIFANSSATGGFVGTVVDSPTFFGIDVDPLAHPERYGGLVLTALVVIGLVVANVRRGRVGRRMLAVRSNERAAAALGISVISVKLYAFGLGAGIAAVGGILLAFRHQNVQFQQFDVFGSILLVQYAVLGGIGWASGAVIVAVVAQGGLLSYVVGDVFPDIPDIGAWFAIVGAIGVIIQIRKAPDGAASLASRQVGVRLAPVSLQRERPAWSPRPLTERRRTPAKLVVNSATVRFGGVTAVDGVSMSVAPGEIVGLIGPNGAGKTTMLDLITGFTRPTHGTVLLDGVDVTRWTPERRARQGMSRSWQGVELFDELTVRENLLIGCDSHERRRFLTDLVRPGRQSLTDLAERVVDDFGLRASLNHRTSSLSQGNARLVGIARAIVGEPSVLLLDEPAAGLGSDESDELAAVIRMIAERQGIGVLIVEHDVPMLLRICDRLVVLDFGQKIADGAPDEIRSDVRVISAYLGEPAIAQPLTGAEL